MVDVLDYLGNKIGEIDETTISEDALALELAKYAAAPVEVFPNVTPRQIRQALILSGVQIHEIDGAINLLPSPYKELAQVEWEYSIAFIRSNALVNQVGAAVGWTSGQLDALWRLASTL